MKTITLITLFVGALAFITNAYASVSANLVSQLITYGEVFMINKVTLLFTVV